MVLAHTLIEPDDVYNRALVENAHPPAWVNPKPYDVYNLVVLGAGTAGLVATAGAAALGARVAITEERLMGGDCLNFGCVPSKAVIRASRAAYSLKEVCEFGCICPATNSFNFSRAMERMRRLRAEISANDSVQRFTPRGAQVFLGAARFTAHDTVEVDGLKLRFKKAIVATGGRPAHPEIPGLAEPGFHPEIWLQGEGDLGARLERILSCALKSSLFAIAIGGDTPGLPSDLFEQARAALHVADAVIGPSEDGGFYLLGMRRTRTGC